VSYWLHPEAEAELGDAAVYYAEHASKAVAMAFLTEFERVLALLIANQQLGAHTDGGLRTYPFRRFPYSLVYREDSVGPKIYAVAHQHREPEYWRDRS
jgi:plasmid stabilization system protein ParE